VTKTASVPYTTPLLITMSISYRRYFNTAMPIEVKRNRNARPASAEINGGGLHEIQEPRGMYPDSVTNTSAVAVTNHFSWRRSSPDEPRNRTATAVSGITPDTAQGTNSSRPMGDVPSDDAR